MPEVLSAPSMPEARKTPSMRIEKPFVVQYRDLALTPQGAKLNERQSNIRDTLDARHLEAKQQVRGETREKLNIERMITEAQTMLYEALGIDPKLERNNTLGKFTKGGIDTIIMDNIDLVKDIIEHGVGKFLLAFREMFSVEGIKRMLEATGKSFTDLFTGDAYITGKAFGTIGMGMFGMVKGAVKSEMKHIVKENITLRNVRVLAEERNIAPPKIGEIIKGFDPIKTTPKEALAFLQSINAHLDVAELIHTTGGIRNFAQSLENLAKHIEVNVEKIGSLRGEYIRAVMELRTNLLQMAKNPEMTQKMKDLLIETIRKDLEKSVTILDARFGKS